MISSWPQIDDSIMLGSLPGERAVELCPAISLDLGVEVATDIEVAARSELEGSKMGGAGAHAVADVIPGDYEVAAITCCSAHNDMDVGIVGVPVVDADPIELGAEIALGLRHEVPCECLEIGKLLSIFRRDDEAEMMAIPFAAIGEGAVIGVVALGIEHSAASTILRYALPT